MGVVRRHALIVFFVLAYLLPWLVWGTTIAQGRGWLAFHLPQPLAFWIGLPLATYLAAALTGGMPAIRDLLSRLIRWQVHPLWYLVALMLSGLLALIAIGVHRALGGSHTVGIVLSGRDLLPALLFQTFMWLLTEETAWRGFALPRLQARYSALTASLILGLLWGLWHTPLVFIPGSFQSQVPFVGFVLSAIATSILATWLFNHTHGSVLIAAIFHGATDATIAYTNVMTGDLRLFWIVIAVQWLAAAAVVITEGSAYLARASDRSGTTFLAAAEGWSRPGYEYPANR